MDYSKYSKMDYTTVVGNFDDIPQVLAKKLYFLNQKGFDASTAYLFGFSLGGHIMLLGAEQYVLHKVANIDSECYFNKCSLSLILLHLFQYVTWLDHSSIQEITDRWLRMFNAFTRVVSMARQTIQGVTKTGDWAGVEHSK